MRKLTLVELLLVGILCLFFGCPALSQQFVRTVTDAQIQSGITNASRTIVASDTTVTLAAPSSHIVIALDPSSSNVWVRLDGGGAATTSNFKIASGSSLAVDLGQQHIASYHFIGDGTVGNISTFAN